MLLIASTIMIALIPGTRTSPRSELVACKSNLKNIGIALELYATDYNGTYPAKLDVLTPNYLKSIPQCPRYFQPSYHLSVGVTSPGKSERKKHYFLVSCSGSNHLNLLNESDYPKFHSELGLVESAAELNK